MAEPWLIRFFACNREMQSFSYSLWAVGVISGRVRALNLTVPLGSGRVGSGRVRRSRVRARVRASVLSPCRPLVSCRAVPTVVLLMPRPWGPASFEAWWEGKRLRFITSGGAAEFSRLWISSAQNCTFMCFFYLFLLLFLYVQHLQWLCTTKEHFWTLDSATLTWFRTLYPRTQRGHWRYFGTPS